VSRRRHPGHLDNVIVDELQARMQAGEWRALELGTELIEVDTSAGLPAVAELTARIAR
jgi:hypothetical protein